MLTFTDYLNEAAEQAVNQQVGGKLLTKMADGGHLSAKSLKFLGLKKDKSHTILSFGPQSSAQAYLNDEFPKASDYYYKEYDMSRAEFLVGAKDIEKALKTRFMTALKKAKKEGVLDSFEAINRILETGADIFAHNDALANDSQRSWRLLDKAISGKDAEDLKMKTW